MLRKYSNIVVVFGISGLWHGANWNFVVWGLLHALYQVLGDLKHKLCKKIIKNNNNRMLVVSSKIRKALCTFCLVDFAWLFFVSSNMTHALALIEQMLNTTWTTSIYELGLNQENWVVLISAIMVVLTIDVLHEKGISVFSVIKRQEFWFRWIVYVGLIWSIIMFGIYGVEYDASTFIYFQF